MDEKRVRSSGAVVGGSSLLVIFAVLCLTVFALLSLSTVQADGRLSQATAESVAAYYAADRAAEEIYARLRAGESPEGVIPCPCEAEGYAYTCHISQTQLLCVEVHRTEEGWRVLRWQAVSAADWEADDSLNLWDGT